MFYTVKRHPRNIKLIIIIIIIITIIIIIIFIIYYYYNYYYYYYYYYIQVPVNRSCSHYNGSIFLSTQKAIWYRMDTYPICYSLKVIHLKRAKIRLLKVATFARWLWWWWWGRGAQTCAALHDKANFWKISRLCGAVSSLLINKSHSNSARLLVLRRFLQRCRRMLASWPFQSW